MKTIKISVALSSALYPEQEELWIALDEAKQEIYNQYGVQILYIYQLQESDISLIISKDTQDTFIANVLTTVVSEKLACHPPKTIYMFLNKTIEDVTQESIELKYDHPSIHFHSFVSYSNLKEQIVEIFGEYFHRNHNSMLSYEAEWAARIDKARMEEEELKACIRKLHEQRRMEENDLEQIRRECASLKIQLEELLYKRESVMHYLNRNMDACPRQTPSPVAEPAVTYLPSIVGDIIVASKNIVRIFNLFSPQETVYSSVFAQAEMERDKHMMIMVYLHTLEETEKLRTWAHEVHPDVERRDNIPLSCRLRRGDDVKVCLYIRGKRMLYNEMKSITWQGSKTKCVFDYLIPKHLEENELSCQIILLTNNGIPIGEMWFVTKITDNSRPLNPKVSSKTFKKVFISYSHKDMRIVQHLAEGFRLMNLDYFFDRHKLNPGDVFPDIIQKYIQSADVFVLYWSQNAAKSEYVKQEIDWALPLAYPQVKPPTESTLTIYPISIEPRAEFPEELKDNYEYIEL